LVDKVWFRVHIVSAGLKRRRTRIGHRATRLVDIEEELTMMNEQETKPDTSKYYYYLLAAALLLLVTVVAVFWRYMR
jgi:hypothetical protein